MSENDSEMRNPEWPAPLLIGAEITVRRTKWPDRDHYRHTATVLGQDKWGLWAGIRRGDWWLRAGQPIQQVPTDVVELIPNEVGWVSQWYEKVDDGPEDELYCDVVGGSVWNGTVVTTVDLDLDIIRTFSGATKLLDEDEFEVHRIELAYPEELVTQARAAANELMRRVESRAAPFDGTHHHWMDVWKNLQS
jgi:hypothetical protein